MLGLGLRRDFNMIVKEISENMYGLIGRSWVRFYRDKAMQKILQDRSPEPDYKIVLSVEGDKYPFEISPEDILTDLTFYDPDAAFEIALGISDLISDDEWLQELLAAGVIESLIKYNQYASKYLKRAKEIKASNRNFAVIFEKAWL